MGGNVSEWVADVYRPIINNDVSDMNYYRGNLYKKPAIGPEGVVIVKDVNIKDMPNNKKYVEELPGEIMLTNLDTLDAKLRPNFNRWDNSDFMDGDDQSKPSSEEDMYKFAVNEEGEEIKEQVKVKSLISDQTRVVKGGSWKDRAYWLDPAQRRYLPEFMAADYIGFRCAMSYLGESKLKKRPRD